MVMSIYTLTDAIVIGKGVGQSGISGAGIPKVGEPLIIYDT